MPIESVDRLHRGNVHSAALVGGATSLLALLLAIRRTRDYLLPHNAAAIEKLYGGLIYNRTVVTPNFFEDGFVRRGLGGTIRYLLPGDWIGNAVAFTVVSAICLALPVGVLLFRRARSGAIGSALGLAAILLLAPQAFRGWGADPGRTDIIPAGFVAWAALAMALDRPAVAALMLILGMMTHETALIFGVPLVILLGLGRRAGHEFAYVASTIFFACGVVAVLVAQRMLSAPSESLITHMLSANPARDNSEWSLANKIATYVLVNGSRGIRSALCFNFDFEDRYILNAAVGLMLLVPYAFILRPRLPLGSFIFAVILPVLVMLVIASDTNRWMRLGFLNAWLLTVMRSDVEEPALGVAIVRTVLFSIVAVLGSTHYYETSRFVPIIGDALHLPRPGSLAQWLAYCDPQWRATLGRP